MGGFGSSFGLGFGMMGGWDGGGIFPFSGIFGLLILALIIAAVVWFAGTILHPLEPAPHTEGHAVGPDLLDQR